jgi:hypothetical protein
LTPCRARCTLNADWRTGGFVKKLGMVVGSGLAAFALIGTMALIMFGADKLLHATILKP